MLSERFKLLSCDAGLAELNLNSNKKSISPYKFPIIESNCQEYEKISLSFLFYDDINSCYKVCEKCIKYPFESFLSEDSVSCYSNWDMKLLECLYHIQHILLLSKLGIGKYDTERYCKSSMFVNPKRLLLYKICENLSNNETKKIMELMPSISPEKYLEMFILKVLLSNKLDVFLSHLSSFGNSVIDSLLAELRNNFVLNENIETDIKVLSQTSITINKEDVYLIKDPQNVGLCFIINEVHFKAHDNRTGSMEDVTLLESTMKDFKFEVEVFSNVPKKFFEEELCKNLQIYFKDNHSVFFMVILSHGEQGVVYCSDDKPVTIDFIERQLSCKLLYKVPKVLIVQACQGNKILQVPNITTDGPIAIEYDQSPSKRVAIACNISDYLKVMATVPGFKAFRDKEKGTWFIQSLCSSLKEKQNECIFSIITQTIRKVKEQTILCQDHRIKIGQQSEMISLLEKKLYLKPCIYF